MYGTLLFDSVASVTSVWVAYILVLYLAGRMFTDCDEIAMGLVIAVGLIGLRNDFVISVWCCGMVGCWACLRACSRADGWVMGVSCGVCGLHCTALDWSETCDFPCDVIL